MLVYSSFKGDDIAIETDGECQREREASITALLRRRLQGSASVRPCSVLYFVDNRGTVPTSGLHLDISHHLRNDILRFSHEEQNSPYVLLSTYAILHWRHSPSEAPHFFPPPS